MVIKNRRSRYLIDRDIQLKYASVLLLFMLGAALLSATIIYYNTWMLVGEKLANVYPQGRLAEIVKSTNIKLALSLLIIAPLVLFATIILSHRVAGPIYNMKKTLEEVSQGNFSQRVHLRKTDELQDMAKSINKVLDKLEEAKGTQRQA